MRQTKSNSAHCFYNCLKRYIIDDILKTHSIFKVSLGMKILTILLIPLFWGIVSTTPSFKEINLIKDELENLDNQQNQNKNLDLGAAITDNQKLKFKTQTQLKDDTRNELSKLSLFPLFQKDRVSSPDKEKIEDTVNPKNVILNRFELGRKLIDQIVQSISKLIHKCNSGISENKPHDIQKRENTKPRNLIVKYRKDERLKSTFNLKNARKRKIIDQEALHSIIPQITVNNNQRGSKWRYNERLKKTDNNGYKTERRQLYTEAYNVQRNKRDSEFTKWLDDTPEYYFDYSEPLGISPKYTPVATNIKAISTKTVLDKTPDKSASIKTYFQPDYEDLHSKWTNDKDFEYYTDLKKSPITWHGYSTADEIIPLSSEWDLIDKTTNDNKNVKSNTNSISKATVSEITNFEDNHKDIDIPSDWIANYKIMKDKIDDTLFFQVGSNTEDNAKTRIVHEDANKSLKTAVDAKNRRNKDDDVLKFVESTSIATTLGVSHQKPSTLIVKDTIVNNKNNTAVDAESAKLTKYNTEDIAINEYKEKQANLNRITAIISDKNSSILDEKAGPSPSVHSTLSVSSKNENELSQYSVKNNSISNIKINTKVIGDKETKDQRSNKNEELTKAVTQNKLSKDKNNSTEVEELILSKSDSSGSGLAYSTDNSDPYKIEVPSEWIVKYKSLDDTDYYSKLAISANSNASNSATTGDPYKPTNWTNEPKVTREPDDKWPNLEANAKTSAVQATAVSTEKIENLLNKKNEETKVLSLKDLTEKDKTTASVTAHSNLNESTITKQTSSNSSEDKKLLSTENNKVIGSTGVDAKTVLITDNNKQKWKSDNSEKVLNANSQLVESAANNSKAATTNESEKVQWEWNDESKNWMVKNDSISDNKVAASVEANAYATAATNNNKQALTLEEVKSVKNNVTLNNQAVAKNTDAVIISADDKNILRSNSKHNNPNIKNDSALDNKATPFSTDNVDITEATDNKNHQWRWNNKEATQSVKDNANLNNKVVALSAGNNKVATSVTDNREVSTIIQSLEKKWKLAENSSELNIQNYDISNIEKTATVKNAYNAEQATIDKKLSWISSEEEKYNVTLDNKEATTVKAYLTTTTTENDKQKWNWDNELKDSSVKDKVLLKNQTETSAFTDSVTAADSKSEIKHEIESKILNDQKIITLNNNESASIETDITSLVDFKYDKLEWDWENEDKDQNVRNNDKSNSKIDSLDKVNRNAAKATASNKDKWKWTSEDKVSSNKSNYLTANKTDLFSEASVKATETIENLKLFNLNDKDENSSLKKEIITNNKAAAFVGATNNSQPTEDNKKNELEKSQSVRDHIIYNTKITELDEVNVKNTANIEHDNRQSKLDEKESDLNITNDVKSNKAIESTQANIDVIEVLKKNRKKSGSDNNNKTESINDELIINDAAAASAASNSSISVILRDKKISWSENENNNSNVKINNTFDNKELKFTKDNTDPEAALQNNKKQGDSNNNNIAQDTNDDFSINNQAPVTAASNANRTVTITSKKQIFKSDDKSNNSKINNNVALNNKAAEFIEINTDVATIDINNKNQWKLDEKKTFSVKDGFTINNQETATAASNGNATVTITSKNQKFKSDNKSNDSSIKNNVSSNNKEVVSTEANTDVTETLEDSKKKQQMSDNNNITLSTKDSLNDQAILSAVGNANTISTIIRNMQQLKLEEKNNNLNTKYNATSNKKGNGYAEDNTDVTATSENNKKQWKSGNNTIQRVKDDLIINNSNASSVESNTNAASAIVLDKQQSRLNNENSNSSVNKSKPLNKIKNDFVEASTDSKISTEVDKQQSKLNNESNDSSELINNLTSSNEKAKSSEANSNAKLTTENDEEQLELNNKEEFKTANKNVISKSQAAVSSVANSVTASGIKSVIKHLKLDNREENLNIKNNVSLNSKSTTFARAKTNATTMLSDDQQQRRLINKDKNANIKDDVISQNKTVSLVADARSKTTGATAVYENQKVLNDINKNLKLKIDITSNSEKATSAIRTDAEAKSKVILTENNDSRKIFDEKVLEVSTHEPISEKSSSTIDTADINLQNMDKNSLSEYNINDKEARARIDVISDLITNTSDTIIVKDSSARENKKKLTDEIAEKSESNIFEVQTDNINETKGKFQSLELKNNNSIQYNHSIAVAEASASAYAEKVYNSLKESNNKLSDWNNNNRKNSIDEIANTKAIAYNVNEGDVDTLVRDNTKVTEWKIKGENIHGHQNLIFATTESKASSVIGTENKKLNKQVKNYTFNNDHSIANVKEDTSAAVEVEVDPSYLEAEINKNSLKNTKASALVYKKSEIDSVEKNDDKTFDKNIYNKNLTDNINLRTGIETKAESNYVSMTNGINKRIDGRYNEEKDSVTKGTIDEESENLVITSSKEKEIINNLNKTSNDLINWFLRWKSVSNVVKSNKNERQNDTKIDNRKSESSYDEKHTIDQLTTTASLIDDKTKDSEKKIEKIDDADLIILKKPYGQQDTIGVTYIKDSVPPMILFRVIPKSWFEQVRKLIEQWEIVRVSYAEPQI